MAFLSLSHIFFSPFSLLGEKFLPNFLFPPSLPQEYNHASIITSNQKQAFLSSFVSSLAGLQTVLPSHVHFSFCIIWVSKVKKDYRHINSIWCPKMWHKNFSFSVSHKHLPSSSGWMFCYLSEVSSYLKSKLSCFDSSNIPSRTRANNCDISINWNRVSNIWVIFVSAANILLQEYQFIIS